MTTATVNNKLIAKNTALLYVRMLLIMAITLYTSRIVLQVLGVEDYGIYNVVGGVVAMISFLNSSLTTATLRFLNYEMGKGNEEGVKKVFSISFWGYCLMALAALLLGETIGTWFVRTQLTIPPERMEAALWVLHFSILTFMVNLLSVPYTSVIIAHERMSVYAYVSIADAALKLLMVFLLQSFDADKLWLYSLMMFIVSCCVAMCYRWSCRHHFPQYRIRRIWDATLARSMFSFSGWLLAGTITSVFSTQGVNILINIFFGPAFNAARGIAVQVSAAVGSFTNNFMTATRPQIVTSYAAGNLRHTYRLVFTSSKICFYLLFLLTIPILFNTRGLLSVWLTVIPESTVLFVQLVLFDMLINSIYTPIANVSQASGKVRDYQLVISIGFTLTAVLTWIFFRMGFPVHTAFVITIAVDVIGLFMRLWVLSRTVNFPARAFLSEVLRPALLVFLAAMLLAYLPCRIFPENIGFLQTLAHCLWCMAGTAACIWLCGMDEKEKQLVTQFVDKIKRH